MANVSANRIARGSRSAGALALPGRWLRQVVFAIGVLGFACGPAAAQDAAAQEQQIKAAYLFKFGGYVEWPANAFAQSTSPLVIGVAGDPPVAQELERIVGTRTLNGRSVEVRQVQGDDPAGVHILFVGRSQLSRMSGLIAHPQPVLVVTDASSGLDQGSIINFVTTGNRVRFEVSLDAARRNTLKIGAPLLAVAMKVQ